MRFVPLFLVLMAWTLGTVSVPKSPAPAEKLVVSDIDVDALHEEARAALERLRQAGARRVAAVHIAEF